MVWWHWILLGLVLAAIELATPGGFFFIFFAGGAVAVGLLELAGLVVTDWVQWAWFSVGSLVCLALVRRPLLERLRGAERPNSVDSLVGEVAVATAPIPAGQHGRAELRGSTWSARNVDEGTVNAGERCRVVAVRGLELDIRSDRGH
jgi:inner membrane protein